MDIMTAQEYNDDLCRERHRGIENKFRDVDAWLEKLDKRLWGLVVLALVQVVGIVALLITTM